MRERERERDNVYFHSQTQDAYLYEIFDGFESTKVLKFNKNNKKSDLSQSTKTQYHYYWHMKMLDIK